MTTSNNQRTWTFPRHMLEELGGLTLLSWLGFVAVIAAIIIGFAVFDTVDQSIWAPASGIAQWYVAFIGGYVTYSLLPLHVVHGRTRRDFAIQAAIFIPIFTAFSAFLVTLGFVLEWALYRINDWPQEISGDHIYSSPTELPLIFISFWLLFLGWGATGALIGAAFYRSNEVGLGALALALVPITITGIALGDDWGPLRFLLDNVMDEPGDISLAASIVAGLASFLLTLAVTWRFVRDIPIRSRPS